MQKRLFTRFALIVVATVLYVTLNLTDNAKVILKPVYSKLQERTPMVMLSREEEINLTIAYVSHHARIPVNTSWISSVRNVLQKLEHPPSIPLDALEKTKDDLQSTVVPPVIRIHYTETWQGYKLPVFTCEIIGRLGNMLGQYTTMYAIHKLYNVSVFIREDMKLWLKDFPDLSLPKLPVPYKGEEWRGVSKYLEQAHNFSPIELAAAGLLGPHQFIMQGAHLEIQLFHKMKDDIRREFTFSINITTKAQKFLENIKERRKEAGFPDVVFIGFHVRRTDYDEFIKYYGGLLPDEKYFHRAINYYREKFPRKAVFIAASDDGGYMKDKFGNYSDVFFSIGERPEEDMGVLSSCNHSIMTFGTYGFFCSFLTGGEVVYPDVKFKKFPDVPFKDVYFLSRARYEKVGLESFTPLPVD